MRTIAPRTVVLTLRLTEVEKSMLRSLAVTHSSGAENGLIRRLIREAWARREARRLTRRRRKGATKR